MGGGGGGVKIFGKCFVGGGGAEIFFLMGVVLFGGSRNFEGKF